MAENQDGPQTATATPGKIVSAGAPVLAKVNLPAQQGADPASNPAQPAAADPKAEVKLPDVNDDQLRELLKGKGIELDDTGFDGLKNKLTAAPAATTTEPTAEEKAAAEAAFEKRMLDHAIANGISAESFVAFKQLASADLKELSVTTITKELKEAGFSDEDIKTVLVERYYQINPDELERDEDNETEEEFAARKKKVEQKAAYGAKKLEAKGASIKKKADEALHTLREAIKSDDLQKEDEVKHSKRVEDFFTKLPRKVTVELGKAADGQDIAPVEYVVSDEDIAEVQSVLQDSVKRKQFLYNEDNSLNLDNVASVMLRNKYLEKLAKDVYLKAEKAGATREVEKFEKLFPGRTAKDIGVGGAPAGGGQGRKGVIASAGKPEKVSFK